MTSYMIWIRKVLIKSFYQKDKSCIKSFNTILNPIQCTGYYYTSQNENKMFVAQIGALLENMSFPKGQVGVV